MTMDRTLSRYTHGEEVFNCITHGLGSAMAVGGMVVMVVLSVLNHSGLALGVSIVYGLSLIVLYTMSTVYHAITNPKVKEIMRIFDHTSIFLLIAGSYTPFCMIALAGNVKGLGVMIAVWGCAILGIILNTIDLKKTEKFGTVLYVIMGWSVIIALPDIIRALPEPAFWLLLFGGISYTGGLVFYAMKNTKYMHGVWHLFVLAGSLMHYFAIAFYVLPMAYA